MIFKNYQLELDALLKSAVIGIILVNKDSIIAINDLALDLFGQEATDSFVGKHVTSIIPPDFVQKHNAQKGQESRYPRTQYNHANIAMSFVSFGATESIYTAIFTYEMATVVSNELSAITQAEYEEKLAILFGLALEMEAKEKELSDLKDRCAAVARGDFRSLLSTILSSAYLVLQYSLTSEQPNREKHIQRITTAVSTLNAMLDDFLNPRPDLTG